MNKFMKLLLAAGMCFSLMGCASGTASNNVSKVVEKKEKSKDVAWEAGDPVVDTWSDSGGQRWIQIVCPVENTGKKNLYLKNSTIDIEDSEGILVDSMTSITGKPDVLKPGDTGYYYEITMLDSSSPLDLKVVPHLKIEEATVDYIRLETSQVNIADRDYGGLKITGRVENNTEDDFDVVVIAAFLYNAENKVLASEYTVLDDVLANDKYGFSVEVYREDITADKVDHYEVFAYPRQHQY